MLNYIAIGIVAFLLSRVPRATTIGGARRPDQAAAEVGPAAAAEQADRALRLQLPPRRRAVRLPAVRHPPRRRLLRPAQPQPLRLRPAGVRPQPRRRPVGRRQPEADGADHDDHVGRRRRPDRPAVPARRPAVPASTATRSRDARVHRARRSRCSDATTRSASPPPRIVWATIERATQRLVADRHPAGDRRDPAGIVPARRRDRLRGGQAAQRRRRRSAAAAATARMHPDEPPPAGRDPTAGAPA